MAMAPWHVVHLGEYVIENPPPPKNKQKKMSIFQLVNILF